VLSKRSVFSAAIKLSAVAVGGCRPEVKRPLRAAGIHAAMAPLAICLIPGFLSQTVRDCRKNKPPLCIVEAHDVLSCLACAGYLPLFGRVLFVAFYIRVGCLDIFDPCSRSGASTISQSPPSFHGPLPLLPLLRRLSFLILFPLLVLAPFLFGRLRSLRWRAICFGSRVRTRLRLGTVRLGSVIRWF